MSSAYHLRVAMCTWWATSKIWSKSFLTQAAGIDHRAPCTAQSVPVGTLGTSSQLELLFVLAAGSCLLVCFRNWVASGVTASPSSADPGGGWWSAAGVERLYLLSHEQLRNMEFFHLSYVEGSSRRILHLPIKPVFWISDYLWPPMASLQKRAFDFRFFGQ